MKRHHVGAGSNLDSKATECAAAPSHAPASVTSDSGCMRGDAVQRAETSRWFHTQHSWHRQPSYDGVQAQANGTCACTLQALRSPSPASSNIHTSGHEKQNTRPRCHPFDDAPRCLATGWLGRLQGRAGRISATSQGKNHQPRPHRACWPLQQWCHTLPTK